MNAAPAKKHRLAILFGVIAFVTFATSTAAAQCKAHPDEKTAVRFNNESSYHVDFYIDRLFACTLPPGKSSEEFEVKPASYLLIGVAMIDGVETWMTVFNNVPAKHVCMWTVADPEPSKDVAKQRSLGGFL